MQHTLPSFCCILQVCVCISSRVLYVIATAFQSATYTTQLLLHSAGLCVHFEQGSLCYSHSLPKCNIHYPASVALCRVVGALRAWCCMLRAQPSRLHHNTLSSCCVLQGCECVTSRVLHVITTAFQLATQPTQLMLHFGVLCLHCNMIAPRCC